MNSNKLNHSIAQACEIIGVGRSTFYSLIKKGEIKPLKIGGRTVVPDAELNAFQHRLIGQCQANHPAPEDAA